MERSQQYRKDQRKTQQQSKRTNDQNPRPIIAQFKTTPSQISYSKIQIEQKSH